MKEQSGEKSSEEKLEDVIALADSVISQKYLSFLTNHQVYQLKSIGSNGRSLQPEKHLRMFHLRKFIYDPEEGFLSKLVTVINVAYSLGGSIITSIQGKGDYVDVYIGVAAKENKGVQGDSDREALLNAFEGTMQGNFNGSGLELCSGKGLEEFCDGIDGKAVCSVSVVPSPRNSNMDHVANYVQGIENLVDSLRGRKYTILTIADPVPPAEISQIRRGYEDIYTYLKPFHEVTRSQGEAKGISLSDTETENYVRGMTESIARTQSRSIGEGTARTKNAGISFVLSVGVSSTKNRTDTRSDGVTNSNAWSRQYSNGQSTTNSVSSTRSTGTQQTLENRTVRSMLDKIEQNLSRLDECEGYGAFRSATYVIADDERTALNVAGNFMSLMKGNSSGAQSSKINSWKISEKTPDTILEYLKYFQHPSFQVQDGISVSCAMMVSGPELAVQLGMPKKSVNGLTVLPMYPFGRNIEENGEDDIELGNLCFMGSTEPQKVKISMNSLCSHTFITGSTGTGKSNVVYGLLDRLTKRNIPYMVIEPAKGEYKNVFGAGEDVRVLGTNPKLTELLRINPFAFHGDVHVLEHIDRLIEIFGVCWPMYAAMPAVLKEAVEDAYVMNGWDLENSENRYDMDIFPNFSDLESALCRVIDQSAYDEEVKSNYKGSLLTRVRSLTNGLNGRVFCSNELEDQELFDRNVIVDLSRIGSEETKALVMGILVMRLQEYRMSQDKVNAPLQHITVLEEAHHLLRKAGTISSAEGDQVAGKSVEMLSNAIAEMRTYGEGFVIADQSPGLLDISVIRNTNTKILLRTPEYSDRMLAGKAAGLNDGQMEELSRLPRGVAAVYQNDWLEPVLCRFEHYSYDEDYRYCREKTAGSKEKTDVAAVLTGWILRDRFASKWKVDYNLLERSLDTLKLSSYDRMQILEKLHKPQEEREHAWEECDFAGKASLVADLLDCRKKLSMVMQGQESTEKMTEKMEQILEASIKMILPDDLRREVMHCMMRCYSEDGSEALEKYYRWDYEMRRKIV